jgi:hypothetical protein
MAPTPQPAERRLEDIKQLRVMTYNVENLFMHVGKGPNPKEIAKDPEELVGVAAAIRAENPDIIIVVEVERDFSTLSAYNDHYLGGLYRPLMVSGNDQRGINIGFLVKRDLPFHVVLESNRGYLGVDPINPSEGPIPIFSRDLPMLSLYTRGHDISGPPLLTILGTHFKSMRDRPGDPRGTALRGAQAQAAAEIIEGLRRRWGNHSRIMIGGDFNASPRQSRELDPLVHLGRVDSMDKARVPRTVEARATHTYHPSRNGVGRPSRLDFMLLSPVLASFVRSSHVHRYIEPITGAVRPIPVTRDDRELNPSDHFPLLTDFRFPEMLAAYEAEAVAERPAPSARAQRQ